MYEDGNATKFFNAYVTCALWSSTDEDDEPLDENYSRDDIDSSALEKMRQDCQEFIADNKDDLGKAMTVPGYGWEQAGRDFWLTRNGHGQGFWGPGLGVLDLKLSDAAHAFGAVDLYVGDDQRLYHT